jgi:thiol:disulfide interchange protein
VERNKTNSPFKPVWGLLFILVAFTAITMIAKSVGARDRIPWRTDVAAAVADGAREKKPVLLYFTATWCGPCQRMKGATWSDAGVEAKLKSYVPVKVDIDHERELAQSYQIDAVPTFVVLDGEGNTVKRETSFMPADEFLAWMDGNR